MLNYIIFVATLNKQNCKVTQSIFKIVSFLLLKKFSFSQIITMYEVNYEISVNYGVIQKVFTL